VPQILVQEIYYNDHTGFLLLKAAAERERVTIRTIMQWPRSVGSRGKTFLPETPQYVYGGFLKPGISD